jgi:hypothetical protein
VIVKITIPIKTQVAAKTIKCLLDMGMLANTNFTDFWNLLDKGRPRAAASRHPDRCDARAYKEIILKRLSLSA